MTGAAAGRIDVRDRRGFAVLVPVFAGLVAALGQPPWGLWWLALPAYAVGIRAVVEARRPLLAGWLFGTSHMAVALHWIAEPFLVDAATTGWLAPVAVVVTCGGLASFWAVGAAFGLRVVGGPVGVALGVALAELARSWVLTGFPWALPGHVYVLSPALPSAMVYGAHGLGLFALLGAALVAVRRPLSAVVGLCLWAVPLLLGAAMPSAPGAAADAPVVRLIQPNAPQHLKWDPDHVNTFWRRGVELTAGEGAVDAILWPETAMPYLLERSDDLRQTLSAASGGRPLVIGVQRYGDDDKPRNALALLTGPTGAVARTYDKHRLVPFGEFLPLPGLFAALGIGPMAAQLAGGYGAGEGPEVFDLQGVGPVLPLICYESIFPQDLWGLPRRPRVILHLTNDAWFGEGAGPRQHLALARLRAAESGLPVLRSANTGISASIDARGGIREALPLNASGALDAEIPGTCRRRPTRRRRLGAVGRGAVARGRGLCGLAKTGHCGGPCAGLAPPPRAPTASWRGDDRAIIGACHERPPRLCLHVRVRLGGAPGQGVRPHLRCGARRVPVESSRRPASPARPSPPRTAWSSAVRSGCPTRTGLTTAMGRIEDIARACIRDIGYEQEKFHHATCEVTNLLHEQSAHIAQGVDAASGKDEGAGDQGIMFGYAVDETPELMPAPDPLRPCHPAAAGEARKSGEADMLGPDAKSQLTVRYEGGRPVGVDVHRPLDAAPRRGDDLRRRARGDRAASS